MKRLPYFRMYTEARNDAKLRHLTDAQFRTWFRILCYAAEQPNRGSIEGVPKRLLAIETAGGDEAVLDETLAVLTDLRIITVDDAATCDDAGGVTLTFRAFACRNECKQTNKPSDKPEATRERQAKSRERRKGNEGPAPSRQEERKHEAVAESVEADGPIGSNSAAEVRRALWVADENYPLGDYSIRTSARKWLAEHPASKVIAAIECAKNNAAARPDSYIRKLLSDPEFSSQTGGGSRQRGGSTQSEYPGKPPGWLPPECRLLPRARRPGEPIIRPPGWEAPDWSRLPRIPGAVAAQPATAAAAS